ncbi:acylneuraminate cytidylyltransferase [Maridesulfovibrio sp.]|uniref:PseG/SpsG family protein n=1 Tax=Maridesulfovibrio sp. TaxID=2795000 RepID=UPI002A189303|nr:acylneuraminate cytidylyltransferase [Maridesulfovibrio sp.]
MTGLLFFCEGSPERGFGHVGRCLALAHSLRDEYGQECAFVFRGSRAARDKIEHSGFVVHVVADFNGWEFTGEPAAILDLLIPLDNVFFDRAKKSGAMLATLDDPTDNRIRCELAFYPPVPQVDELDWSGFRGKIFKGWQYIPLRNEFSGCCKTDKTQTTPQLLITMGGSDPHGLTVKTLEALRELETPWSAKVIAGPMCKNLDKIDEMRQELGSRVELLSNVKMMAELMQGCDLAVASFGMTAYELAACAVPQLLLSITEDHARSASALHQSGAAISLGKFDRVSIGKLTEMMRKLISDIPLRREMSAKAKALGIGNGASNIASVILEKLKQ